MKLINTALICIGMISSYSQGMSSEDLFKYALENSPIIKNSNLDVDMADQQIKQALTSGYPKINGSLSFQNLVYSLLMKSNDLESPTKKNWKNFGMKFTSSL